MRSALQLCLLAFGCSLAFSQPGGSVRGAVKNESRQAVAGARVVAFPSGGVGKPVRGDTDDAGAFSLTGVAAGTYSICVQDRGSLYLDPCQWSTPTQVRLTLLSTIWTRSGNRRSQT